LFEASVKLGPRPVIGDNYIRVNSGQIVDAGLLNIDVLQSGGFLMGGRGQLVASEAPMPFREAIRQHLPKLYPRITYTKFSSYAGFLLPNIQAPAAAAKEKHAKAQ
jgi:hypothetical protein